MCTCAGIAPGYTQHESMCGVPEDDYDDELETLVAADVPGDSDDA